MDLCSCQVLRDPPVALPFRFSREPCGGNDTGVRSTKGGTPADVVEMSMRENDVADGRTILQAEIGHCRQDAIRTRAGVDGDYPFARLNEREVAKVIGLGDVHVRGWGQHA